MFRRGEGGRVRTPLASPAAACRSAPKVVIKSTVTLVFSHRKCRGTQSYCACTQVPSASHDRAPPSFDTSSRARLFFHAGRGGMEVRLRQLTELYDAAGTPDALRMSHRCAALLTALRNGEEERPIDELVDLA